jgi:hypothetical protein
MLLVTEQQPLADPPLCRSQSGREVGSAGNLSPASPAPYSNSSKAKRPGSSSEYDLSQSLLFVIIYVPHMNTCKK